MEDHYKIESGATRRFTRRSIHAINPHKHPVQDKIRVFVLALALNVALRLGFILVLIGPCRTGKSYLLKKTLPGKVIDYSPELIASGKRHEFNLSEVPIRGPFAVDEIAACDPQPLFEGVIALAQRGQCFALAAQSHRDLDEANIARALMGRRVLVVSIKPR